MSKKKKLTKRKPGRPPNDYRRDAELFARISSDAWQRLAAVATRRQTPKAVILDELILDHLTA